MKKNYLEICSALKEQREKAQLTQDELSQYFGCNERLIEEWESGISEPTISECLVLSKLYGIPLDDMFVRVDVSSVIPEERMDSFLQKCQLNAQAKRWYH